MKQLVCNSSNIEGNIIIPSSKSHSHRAIIFGAMGKGVTTIKHLLRSPDTEGMLEAWKTLGVAIEDNGNEICIKGLSGKIDGADNVIDVGNSGIALRFLSTLSALSEKPIVITGDESIRHQRPMLSVLESLGCLGVEAISTKNDGFAPLIIKGPMAGGKVIVNGRDSQPVSALLIASIFAKGMTHIEVEDAGEIPWVQLTLDWLDRLNITYANEGFSKYTVKGNECYDGFDYTVPGDWSSAAFPAAAALVAKGSVTLHNVDSNDCQGDKQLFSLFEQMGADVVHDINARTVTVSYKQALKGIHADINDCIDCVTILAVVACFAEGKTTIVNASVAKEKECDRLVCITNELRKMGADITDTEDGLIINGSPLTGAEVDSHKDHRMAMSLAVASLGASGQTIVNDVSCISKTYPSFAEDMKSIGANIQ